MGKINSGASLQDVKVKVPRGTGSNRCGPELIGYLACLDANNSDEAACTGARGRLAACMAADRGLKPTKHKAPVNFHLHRFLRSIKR